ncbi:MAG TPA: restriction endonuclease subunit S [Chitinophagaceae bacterium]|nr:restriction endonuclease subunit S [Chitinophagaceae bacterium]
MKFGLDDSIIEKLQAVLETCPKIDKAYIFGSRAKGNYRADSDIDIAVKGYDITLDDIIKLGVAFEEKGITHKIDLLDYNNIKEPALAEHIDRVGIEFYSRWKEVSLGELCLKIGSGATPTGGSNAYKVSGISLIRSQNVLDYRFTYDGLAFIDEDQAFALRNVSVQENDILLNITGDSVARCCKVPKEVLPARVNQHVAIIRPDKQKLNGDFLLYYLQFKKEELLILSEIGGTRNALTKTMIEGFTLSLPPLAEQTVIASVLSSLDDKIDLLHRQNKTLEELAETLFRQWFIEEAEESWENRTLGEFVETTLGGEWGKENSEGEYQLQVQCIRGTDIADLETGIPERTPIRFIKQTKFQSIEIRDGDLIMEISGGTDDQSTGRTAYINKDVKSLFKHLLIFSNFCRLIRPKRKEYSFFLYSYIHHLYNQGELFNLENGSSGIKNLNYKALLFDLKFALPAEKRIINYHKDVELYFHKINKNKLQIQTHTNLRDTLLPKLVSGEVRVNM